MRPTAEGEGAELGKLLKRTPSGFTAHMDDGGHTLTIWCDQRKTAVMPALPALGLVLMLPFLPLAIEAALTSTGAPASALLWSWSCIWTLLCLGLAYLLAWNLFGRTVVELKLDSVTVTKVLLRCRWRRSVGAGAIHVVRCGKWRAGIGSRDHEFGSVSVTCPRNKRLISWQHPHAARWLRSVLAQWYGVPIAGAWSEQRSAVRATLESSAPDAANWAAEVGASFADAPSGFSVGISDARDATVIRCEQRQAGALTWLPMLVIGISLPITGFGVLMVIGTLGAVTWQLAFALLFLAVCLPFPAAWGVVQLWNCLGSTEIALARDSLVVTKSLLWWRRRWSAGADEVQGVQLHKREVTTGNWVSPESGRVWELWSVAIRGPKQNKLLSWQRPEGATWTGKAVSQWFGVPLKQQ